MTLFNDPRDPRIKSKNGFKYIPKDRLTQEELAEYIRCKTDFKYFLSNYFYIKNSDTGGIEVFKPYQKQIIADQLFLNEHFVIILKSRQTGMSTNGAGLATWGTIFFDNWGGTVISRRGKEAIDFSNKVRLAYKKLGENHAFLMQPVEVNNLHFKELANGSSLTASTTTPEGVRGDTQNFLFIDEAAFAKNVSTFYDASAITLSRVFAKHINADGTYRNESNRPWGIMVSSTPNGKHGDGEFFYETWANARHLNSTVPDSEMNEFVPLIFHWSEVDEFDERWYNKQRKILRNNKLKILQELELVFLDSTSSVLPNDLVQNIITLPKPMRRYFNGKLNVYYPPKAGKDYILAGDLATGETVGNSPDDSAFVIMDAHTGMVVADFAAYVKYIPYCKIVLQAASLYNNALVAIERQGGGIAAIQYLRDTLKYQNLYKHTEDDVHSQKTRFEYIYGIQTTSQTRNNMIDQAIMFLYDQPYLNSNRILSQLTTLENRRGKIAAYGGNHDDLVMCYAIAVEVRRVVYGYEVGASIIGDLGNGMVMSDASTEVLNIMSSLKSEDTGRNVDIENKIIEEASKIMDNTDMDFDESSMNHLLDLASQNTDPLMSLTRLAYSHKRRQNG